MVDSPSEFARPFELAALSDGPVALDLSATVTERAALAARFGLPDIADLTATATVTRRLDGTVAVQGHLAATVTQICVVSLDPFESRVEDRFETLFQPGDAPTDDPLVSDPEAEDVEPLDGDRLDLGELVAQHLSLALDPHPRKPGVVLEAGAGENGPDEPGPFADLKRLMRER